MPKKRSILDISNGQMKIHEGNIRRGILGDRTARFRNSDGKFAPDPFPFNTGTRKRKKR